MAIVTATMIIIGVVVTFMCRAHGVMRSVEIRVEELRRGVKGITSVGTLVVFDHRPATNTQVRWHFRGRGHGGCRHRHLGRCRGRQGPSFFNTAKRNLGSGRMG